MFAQGKLDQTLLHSDDGPNHAHDHDEPALPFQAWADAPVSAPETASTAMSDLRELADPEADPGADPEGLHLPPPGLHTTGSQLRHRLVTPESIAELAAIAKPSLLQRLLGRK